MLRATWMLMGIISGDWRTPEVAPELVNADKAREKAIRIMALHPQSPHAKRLRQALQLNPQTGGISHVSALPIEHIPTSPKKGT